MIAEISSLETLTARIGDWSSKDVMVKKAPGPMSLEWVLGVLGKLEQEGSDGEGECECLGRRMGTFESVEAEGRQFGRAVRREFFGVARKEGEEVPTRVLFDRSMPAAVAGKSRGASSGVEGEGKGKQAVGTAALQSGDVSSAEGKGTVM